jgi:pimeloyl-ACP methyl ester carboxylesterase
MQFSIHPGRYRHYKGKEYTVFGVALHSETQEELVVYRQEYGDHGLWVRPKQMFLETVGINGDVMPRFRFLGTSVPDAHQVDKVLSYLNQRAFFPQTTTVPATMNVRSGSIVLGCHVLRSHPDAGWIVYFHGNGELAAECVDYCGDLFASAGVNACFVEYRGYGQSDGVPALVAMLGDGEEVVRALGVPAERVVAFGRSLGSIYAIELAHRLPGLGGLVLESGIASITDIWPIPDDSENEVAGRGEIVTALASHFDHQTKLSKYNGPLLVLHAAGDHLVPQSHAERLCQWGGGKHKRLAILPNGNHNTILTANVPAYVAEIERFVHRSGLGLPERCKTGIHLF